MSSSGQPALLGLGTRVGLSEGTAEGRAREQNLGLRRSPRIVHHGRDGRSWRGSGIVVVGPRGLSRLAVVEMADRAVGILSRRPGPPSCALGCHAGFGCAIYVSRQLVDNLRPGIALQGDGHIDWYVGPWQHCPPGRYRVIDIQKDTLLITYDGPIPDPPPEGSISLD